jgi:hypothetical protein
MNKTNKGYDGPTLHIIVTGDSPSGRQWQVTMKSADATGARELGYRAKGHLNGLNDVIFEYGPAVHDEYRDVWTTMNTTDRPDLRNTICDLVLKAADKMQATGQAQFEHLID